MKHFCINPVICTVFLSIIIFTFSISPIEAGQTITLSLTHSNTLNSSGLRGFSLPETPGPIPFPNTSIPCCLQNGTQFGNGVSLGSSDRLASQGCDLTELNATGRCLPLTSSQVSQDGRVIQSEAHGLISRLQLDTQACNGLGTGFRCNVIADQLNQTVPETGQVFSLQFNILSLTDVYGNQTGAATGTFQQTVNDPQSTGGLTKTCTGTFTYDPVNGYQLISGPVAGCP